MQNPVWDETFHFDIHNGKEEIRISVMDRNMMKQDTVVGVLFIPVETLRDQQKIEDWFNLENPHGGYGESNGRIRLQLWWIHSKTKLIEDRIMQTEEDIDKILSDKKYYIEKVAQLREPFGWLEASATLKNSPSKGSYSQFASYKDEVEVETEDDETLNNPLVKATSQVGDRERNWARLFESVSDNFSQGLGMRTTPWFKVMQYFNILYSVMTLLVCFLRTDFVNLTVCVMIYY